MIPIFDAINEHISTTEVRELIEEQKIITLPLAYMRGNTFKNAFVLLDEAQNATMTQMHLFLTRIGSGSKMVVTGDLSQSDLGYNNGFADAIVRLKNLEGVQIVSLDSSTVVRHPIIGALNDRYAQKNNDLYQMRDVNHNGNGHRKFINLSKDI